MFKTHEIQQGRKTVTAYELTRFAFRTEKGTFTLVGTETRGTETIDTWKNITTGEFHEWQRSSIKSWWEQGKIKPMPESTHPLWYRSDLTSKTTTNTKQRK